METRVATEADLPAISNALTRAFEQDPVWRWGFEGAYAAGELAGPEAVFGYWARTGLRLGWVRVTANVEAAALWIPPDEPEMTEAEAERFPSFVAESLGEQDTSRVLALMDAFDGNHPHGPPHFYLSLLGTHPDHAGRGLGMGLVAACLEEIDSQGARAFLESSNPANLGRYERLGFRPRREVDLVPGIRATQMWRETR